MKHILEEAIIFSNKNSELFKFNSQSYAAYPMGIYASLIELAQAFHLLISGNHFTGSLSIYRTFIENYVDLRNLVKDLNYVHQLEYDNYHNNLRIFKAAKKGNRYLGYLHKTADEKISELTLKKKAKKTSAKIKIVTTILDKFIKAEMEEEYKGLYPFLCSEAHSSLFAIHTRHFQHDDNTGRLQIKINQPDNQSFYMLYTCYLAEQLVHSGELIATFLNGQNLEQFTAKRTEIRDNLASAMQEFMSTNFEPK